MLAAFVWRSSQEGKRYAGLVFLTVFCLGVAFIVPILNLIWPGCQPNCP